MTDVVVAMSGGVDSSVAAALLKQQGHEVTGMMMRLWSEPGSESANRCCAPDAVAMARRVAAKLDIPFYVVDARSIFRDVVVQYFLDGYAQGITPNPCLACNRFVRWEFLLHQALASGASFLATGHYARIATGETRIIQLLRGIDTRKDQSYVLSILNQDQLRHALFPVGEYTKPQIRQMAREFGLPVAERPESQDLCFLGEEDYRDFLGRYIPGVKKPGLIVNRAGKELGEHQGLAFYTIGQRKGLGIPSSVPLYVIEKDIPGNKLIVGTVDELGRQELRAIHVNWVSGDAPAGPIRAQIKIRYKASDTWAQITPGKGERVDIQLEAPLRDITPGQVVVFYQGEICLGSGIIEI
jgi:tRNA-uridine 2-sulfurtransferase